MKEQQRAQNLETLVKAEGIRLFATLDGQERHLVGLGVFPAGKVKEVEDKLVETFRGIYKRLPGQDERRQMARWLVTGVLSAHYAADEPSRAVT